MKCEVILMHSSTGTTSKHQRVMWPWLYRKWITFLRIVVWHMRMSIYMIHLIVWLHFYIKCQLPNNFTSLLHGINILCTSINSGLISLLVHFCKKTCFWNLVGFTCMQFSINQLMAFSVYVLKALRTVLIIDEIISNVLSSAQFVRLQVSIKSNRSFTKILKRKGQRLDPCGIPFTMGIQ